MDSIEFPGTAHLAVGTLDKAISMPTDEHPASSRLLKRWKILSIHDLLMLLT
jgi:hypothetical protein